jgi:hypothetical protein
MALRSDAQEDILTVLAMAAQPEDEDDQGGDDSAGEEGFDEHQSPARMRRVAAEVSAVARSRSMVL